MVSTIGFFFFFPCFDKSDNNVIKLNTEISVDKARVLPQTLTPYESILSNKERCSHEIKEDY